MCDVKRLYFKLREEVFGQVDMARRSQALDGFLQAHLGTQMKMGDIQHPRSEFILFLFSLTCIHELFLWNTASHPWCMYMYLIFKLFE